MLFIFLFLVVALVVALAVEAHTKKERSFYNECSYSEDSPLWKYMDFFKRIHMSGLSLYDAGSEQCGVTRVSFRGQLVSLIIDVSHYSWGDEISISEIVIDPEHRSLGEGTKVMKMICRLADEHKINLFLEACDVYGSDAHEVAAFFGKFGFDACEDPVVVTGGTFIDMKRNAGINNTMF